MPVKKILPFVFVCLLVAMGTVRAAEIRYADYNDQNFFNNFSGDHGTFAGNGGSVTASFETGVCHGPRGAALRIDYSVPAGFCGVWNSLLGRDSFPRYSLNFTNLYGGLRNSAGNPSRIE